MNSDEAYKKSMEYYAEASDIADQRAKNPSNVLDAAFNAAWLKFLEWQSTGATLRAQENPTDINVDQAKRAIQTLDAQKAQTVAQIDSSITATSNAGDKLTLATIKSDVLTKTSVPPNVSASVTTATINGKTYPSLWVWLGAGALAYFLLRRKRA